MSLLLSSNQKYIFPLHISQFRLLPKETKCNLLMFQSFNSLTRSNGLSVEYKVRPCKSLKQLEPFGFHYVVFCEFSDLQNCLICQIVSGVGFCSLPKAGLLVFTSISQVFGPRYSWNCRIVSGIGICNLSETGQLCIFQLTQKISVLQGRYTKDNF